MVVVVTMRNEEKVEIFFKRRFPNKSIETEKMTGYFFEWIYRFNTPNPTASMDAQSLEIYNRLKAEGLI